MQLAKETLQFTDSIVNVAPSLSRIFTIYAVIIEPPFAGATQVMVTLVLEFNEVDGAAGTLGSAGFTIYGPLPVLRRDSTESPTAFVAYTVA